MAQKDLDVYILDNTKNLKFLRKGFELFKTEIERKILEEKKDTIALIVSSTQGKIRKTVKFLYSCYNEC